MTFCLNKNAETKYVSPDEPMLRELERRDGIYSFIFHELEARKPETVMEAATAATTNTVTTTNATDCRPNSVQTIPMVTTTLPANNKKRGNCSSKLTTFESAKLATKTDLSANFKTPKISPTPTPTPALLPFKTAFSDYAFMKNESTDTTAVSCTSVDTSATATPPANARDQRCLSEYLPKCQICVIPTPPRFSHLSVPMVRKRRHILKESAEYRRSYSFRNSIIPDLRDLFPHDPDVFTPFNCTPKMDAEFLNKN